MIEDAASKLFAEQGYAATKLTDVAAAAGVTKQLLYQHFASKRELHLALLARHRDELLAGTAAGMAGPGSLPERDRRLGRALVRIRRGASVRARAAVSRHDRGS